MALHSIRNIYETHNIYQSIVICKDSHFQSVYQDLLKDGYPVSPLTDLSEFQQFNTRMLALTDSEWNLRHDDVMTPSINAVLFMDCQPSKTDMFLLRNASVFIFSI